MAVRKWLVAGGFALGLVGMTTSGFAVDFKPFTPVQNVCPECEQPKADEVEFNNGQKVRGTVVSENHDFYVMLRYGEVRAIPRSMVKNISWADGSKPSGLNSMDQILLKNGHVFSGTIIKEQEKPALMKIKVTYADITFTVYNSEIDRAYKNGTRYQFASGAAD